MVKNRPTKIPIDEKIRRAYLQLLTIQRFDRIKVKDIIEVAHISHGSFYTYYDSALDVLEDIEDRFLAQLTIDQYTPDTLYGLTNPTNELFVKLSQIAQQMPTFKCLLGVNGDPYFEYKINRFFDDKLTGYYQKLPQTTTNKLDQELLQQAVNGTRWSLLKWWAQHDQAISTEELAQFLNRYMALVVTLTTKS